MKKRECLSIFNGLLVVGFFVLIAFMVVRPAHAWDGNAAPQMLVFKAHCPANFVDGLGSYSSGVTCYNDTLGTASPALLDGTGVPVTLYIACPVSSTQGFDYQLSFARYTTVQGVQCYYTDGNEITNDVPVSLLVEKPEFNATVAVMLANIFTVFLGLVIGWKLSIKPPALFME